MICFKGWGGVFTPSTPLYIKYEAASSVYGGGAALLLQSLNS